MKRLIALILAVMLMLSFAACGSDEETKSEDSQTPTQSQEEQNAEDPTPTDDENDQAEVAFTEQVVIDHEECLVKITGIEPDNTWGYSLKAYVENKSADKSYTVSIDSASLNGVQCTPLFIVDVAAGKKANESIIFVDDQLKDNGVGEYTDIELNFSVFDSEDWMSDPIVAETVHVYPFGEAEAETFVRQPQESDKVLIDNESITVIVTGYEEDEFWGYSVNMFLVNKTDKTLMFSSSESSVNGFMVDLLLAETVSSGLCAFGSLTLSDADLEENGITDIEEMEFKLQVYDLEDWEADYVAEETVTLNP